MPSDVDLDERVDTTAAATTARDPLTIVTAVALVGAGAMFLWGLILAARADDPEYDLMSLSGLLLASAGVALVRRPWSTLPGTALAVLVTFVSPLFQEYTAYHLTNPQEFAPFAAVLTLEGFGLIATVAGAATFWRRRSQRRPATAGVPRWIQLLISAVAAAVATGLIFGAGVASGTIAGGGGAGGAASAVPDDAVQVDFVADAIAFQEAPEEATEGPLAFQLDNRDVIVHDVTVEGVNNDQPIVTADADSTGTGTVELDEGTYTYYCSVPGHREAGMEGTLTVTAP
jgi:plastocyanin